MFPRALRKGFDLITFRETFPLANYGAQRERFNLLCRCPHGAMGTVGWAPARQRVIDSMPNREALIGDEGAKRNSKIWQKNGVADEALLGKLRDNVPHRVAAPAHRTGVALAS